MAQDANQQLKLSVEQEQLHVDQAHNKALELCLQQCEHQVAAVRLVEQQLCARKLEEAHLTAQVNPCWLTQHSSLIAVRLGLSVRPVSLSGMHAV